MAYTCGAQTVSLHDGILDDSSTSQSKIKWKEIVPNIGLFNSESIIQQCLEYCARQ